MNAKLVSIESFTQPDHDVTVGRARPCAILSESIILSPSAGTAAWQISGDEPELLQQESPAVFYPIGIEPTEGTHFHPERMAENSPSFQGWVRNTRPPSPEGTADSEFPDVRAVFSAVPSGLEGFSRANPRLKPWAILKHPFGMIGAFTDVMMAMLLVAAISVPRAQAQTADDFQKLKAMVEQIGRAS